MIHTATRWLLDVQAVRISNSAAVFRFATQVGMLPLTGTTDFDHMREDLECFKIELSPDELAGMEAILL